MVLKLITIDLDETLLRSDKSYDIDRFNKALKKLREQDILVAILTGNTYNKIGDYFSEDIRPELYFACDNGNYILKNEKALKKIGIPYKEYTQIIDFIDEFEGYHPVVSTGEYSFFREESGPAFEFVSLYDNDLQIIPLFSELPEDTLLTKIAIANRESLDQNKRLARIIRERYEQVDAVTSGEGWVDVYNGTGGKGASVQFLQEKYNITPAETMAFGDSLNDQSMMEQAQYSVAMENADTDLAMHCRYRIGNNNDQAVLEVIETFLENGNLDFLENYRTLKP